MKGESMQSALPCTWATSVPVQSRIHYARDPGAHPSCGQHPPRHVATSTAAAPAAGPASPAQPHFRGQFQISA